MTRLLAGPMLGPVTLLPGTAVPLGDGSLRLLAVLLLSGSAAWARFTTADITC